MISIHAPHAGCDAIPQILVGGKWGFQSTHPMRGATRSCPPRGLRARISIHAPHAGCDPAPGLMSCCKTYFNPRTPCGVRLCGEQTHGSTMRFQSTHPMRGATSALSPPPSSPPYFNPRTPCGVRRHVGGGAVNGDGISIHAPHAGCDYLTLCKSSFA